MQTQNSDPYARQEIPTSNDFSGHQPVLLGEAEQFEGRFDGQLAADVATMSNNRRETQQLWNQVYGLAAPAGAQLTLLKYGRDQESEADHLGVIFMAMAGYNPEEAITFWQRMANAAGKGQKPPQFLSTHPSDDKRIRDLQRLMPEAKKYYGRSGQTVSARR